jgi:hypothetical protein
MRIGRPSSLFSIEDGWECARVSGDSGQATCYQSEEIVGRIRFRLDVGGLLVFE